MSKEEHWKKAIQGYDSTIYSRIQEFKIQICNVTEIKRETPVHILYNYTEIQGYVNTRIQIYKDT